MEHVAILYLIVITYHDFVLEYSESSDKSPTSSKKVIYDPILNKIIEINVTDSNLNNYVPSPEGKHLKETCTLACENGKDNKPPVIKNMSKTESAETRICRNKNVPNKEYDEKGTNQSKRVSISCHAEPVWYSANVINDGDYSPKPLSEIFTTGPPFSTKNPIVVLPPSSVLPLSSSSLSSTFPSTHSSDGYISSTLSPIPNKVTQEFLSSTPSTMPTQFAVDFMSTTASPISSMNTQDFVSTPASSLPTKFTQDFSTTSSSFPTKFTVKDISSTTQSPLPPLYSIEPQLTLTSQADSGIIDQRQPFLFPFPTGPENPPPKSQVPPNYFFIYQQGLQNPPNTNPPSTFSTQQTLSTDPPSSPFSTTSIFSTPLPDLSTPSSTFSTSSSFRPEVTTQLSSSLSTFQPNTMSTLPTSFSSTASPGLMSVMGIENTTPFPFPCANASGFPNLNPLSPANNPLNKFPTLKIRMVSPKGSITNININPTTSTRRTTTRRPTTTKTRRTKKNRNSYDGCINACVRRSQICAAPLAQSPIDPNKLKGFPSICHMACHNSFRKDQYEMLVDGRCGKLRTRIRTADSDKKLTKIELNKAQYTVEVSNS